MNAFIFMLLAAFPSDDRNSTPDVSDVRIIANVTIDETSGYTLYGSGVIITQDHVLTNYHVVQNIDEGKARIVFHDWTNVTATVVGIDPKNDIAILSMCNMPKTFPPRKLSTIPPIIGETLTFHGFDGGLFMIADGEVSYPKYLLDEGTARRLKHHFMLKGNAARQGDSGGAVLRDDELVGIIWGTCQEEDKAFGVTVTPILELMKGK